MYTTKSGLPQQASQTKAEGSAVSSHWIDVRYLCSLLGAGKLVQVLFGVLICGCISRGLCYYTCTGTRYSEIGAGGQHFVLLVASVCIILSSAFFLLHFLAFLKTIASVAPLNASWLKFELIYSCAAVVFYFIAFCIEAAYSSGHHMYNNYDHGAWIAAAVFCFCNWCLYIASAVLVGRQLGISFDVVFPKRENSSVSAAPQRQPATAAPVMAAGAEPPAYYQPPAPYTTRYIGGSKTITV